MGLDIADPQTATLSLRLRASHSALGIIFILQPNSRFGIKEIQALDVDGLLLDGISHRYLVECVNAVAAGKKWIDNKIVQQLLMSRSQQQAVSRLTGRESEIADLVSRGLRNKTIAQQLNVSEGTVKMHLHHVYAKLNLGSRAELAWMAHGKSSELRSRSKPPALVTSAGRRGRRHQQAPAAGRKTRAAATQAEPCCRPSLCSSF